MSTRLGPIAAQQARTARLLAQAEDRAAAHALREQEVSQSLPVVLVPSNGRPLVPLPAASREAFLQQLREVVGRVFETPRRDNAQAMSAEAAEARVSAGEVAGAAIEGSLSPAMVGAACAACRGHCCNDGGTHAFLKADSLVRVRAQHAESAADDASVLVARYERHLPARHHRGSCVFHAAGGCALPRALRSNLCNRYQCDGLTRLQGALGRAGATSAYVGIADTVRLRRMLLLRERDDTVTSIPC